MLPGNMLVGIFIHFEYMMVLGCNAFESGGSTNIVAKETACLSTDGECWMRIYITEADL